MTFTIAYHRFGYMMLHLIASPWIVYSSDRYPFVYWPTYLKWTVYFKSSLTLQLSQPRVHFQVVIKVIVTVDLQHNINILMATIIKTFIMINALNIFYSFRLCSCGSTMWQMRLAQFRVLICNVIFLPLCILPSFFSFHLYCLLLCDYYNNDGQ